MISLYFANPGGGKTSFLSKIAHSRKYKKKYDKIFCNVPIKDTYMFDVTKDLGISHIENSLILIDEGAIELDNRTPLKSFQKTFLRLHRHYKCDIIICSQSWEDVNIVVRRLYDHIYLINRIPLFKHWSVIRRIKKCIDISEEGQIVDMYYFTFLGLRLFYRRPYYKYFNSYDKPQLTDIDPCMYPVDDTKKRNIVSLLKLKKDKKKVS